MENDLRELWYKWEFTVRELLAEISEKAGTLEKRMEAMQAIADWIKNNLSREQSCMTHLIYLLEQWKN